MRDGGKNNGQKNKILTAETWGMILILFSFLSLMCLLTRDLVFGNIGLNVAYFLLGVFGFAAYAFLACVFYVGFVLVSGKRLTAAPKTVAMCLLLFLCLVLLVHSTTSSKLDMSSFGNYVKACFQKGSGKMLSATGGGAVFAIIVFPIAKLITFWGAYALFALAIAAIIYGMAKDNSVPSASKAKKPKKDILDVSGFKSYPDAQFDFSESNEEGVKQSKRLHCYEDDFELKTKKELKQDDKKRNESLKVLYPGNMSSYYQNMFSDKKSIIDERKNEDNRTYQQKYTQEINENVLYPSKPIKIVTDTTKYQKTEQDTNSFIDTKKTAEQAYYKEEENMIPGAYNYAQDFSGAGLDAQYEEQSTNSPYMEEDYSAFNEPEDVIIEQPKKSKILKSLYEEEKEEKKPDFLNEFDDDFVHPENIQESAPKPKPAPPAPVQFTEKTVFEKPKPQPPKTVKKPFVSKYNPPPLTLFNDISIATDASKENFAENIAIIEETLSNFEIPAKVVNTIHGPTITRYDIDIPRNIQAKRVAQYADDLALRLQSAAGVRVEQNPAQGVIAIEVPNKEKSIVGLRNVLDSTAFKNTKPTSLAFGVGMDVTGTVIVEDIVGMTHMLVAGSTGSGKSVCLNTLIISLITKYSPEDLRMILIDPKRVEFTIYGGLPHLVINEIICDAVKAITALNWAIDEMERRYVLFNDATVRDIDEYNETIDRTKERKLPKIVVIVDELADLMMSNKREIEDRIMKLTQKSRAAGIHLVLATQRPSVDIITGVIKTNLPSRIAFSVASAIDSRTILDEMGAEKLLGNGDLLYKTGKMKSTMRVQGAYISMKEVKGVVDYIKENNESYFDEEISNYINSVKDDEDDDDVLSGDSGKKRGTNGEVEEVYIDALQTVILAGQASVSMIQRKFSVGYIKAGKIIDWMEGMGFISKFEGSKSRNVLITMDEFERKFGPDSGSDAG